MQGRPAGPTIRQKARETPFQPSLTAMRTDGGISCGKRLEGCSRAFRGRQSHMMPTAHVRPAVESPMGKSGGGLAVHPVFVFLRLRVR